jgi:hypothetical protein
MHDSALFEIKALLTLALLKSGTSAKDIQTAVNVASAARLMASEEYAELARSEESRSDANVANIREVRHGEAAGSSSNSRKPDLQVDGMNSDIKALLSLLLLQHGASSKEILTTLRLAAAARTAEVDQVEPVQIAEESTRQGPEKRSLTAKQALRNERLAPVSRWARAA